MPLETLCLRLAAVAETSRREDVAFVLRMAAQLATDSGIEVPNVADQFIGTWLWDVPKDQVFIEPLAALAFGVDPGVATTGLPISRFAQAMHLDDVDRVMSSINRCSQNGGPYSEVYRTAVNGNVRTILAQGYVAHNEQKQPQRFSGALFDLSETYKTANN